MAQLSATALMSFLSICYSLGESPFENEEIVVSREIGREAWELLSRLAASSHPGSLAWNPIKALDRMSETDEISCVPLLFGYSNYGRPGFRSKIVRFTVIPRETDDVRGGILGGVGLAVSSQTQYAREATNYAQFVASGEVQQGIYLEAGGQPGHRSAWTNSEANAMTANFFFDTLPAIDHAYMRPRYNGFLEVQEQSGRLLHEGLLGNTPAHTVLDDLDSIYRRSRGKG